MAFCELKPKYLDVKIEKDLNKIQLEHLIGFLKMYKKTLSPKNFLTLVVKTSLLPIPSIGIGITRFIIPAVQNRSVPIKDINLLNIKLNLCS